MAKAIDKRSAISRGASVTDKSKVGVNVINRNNRGKATSLKVTGEPDWNATNGDWKALEFDLSPKN